MKKSLATALKFPFPILPVIFVWIILSVCVVIDLVIVRKTWLLITVIPLFLLNSWWIARIHRIRRELAGHIGKELPGSQIPGTAKHL